jgi:hypothetical protein
MSVRRWLIPLALLLAALPALAVPSSGPPLADRLTEPRLSALHRDSTALRQKARPTPHSGEYQDIRCVFHAHSRLSHDSRGTEAEIVAAAKAAGIKAVFMTEHPTPERAWATEGLRGVKEGVLFVPGAELSDGLLLWRTTGTEWTPGMKASEVLERLKDTGAVRFIAHPEGRKTDAEWDLPPYDGMEIYNSHADATDNDYTGMLDSFRTASPLKTLQFLGTLKRYPQEAFASIFDEQTAVLGRWDAQNLRFLETQRHVVGIAANDSHQNVGVSLESGGAGLLVKDGLGKTVGELDRNKLPLLFLGGLTPGATILSHTFDPYPVSFGYVSTHVLAPEVTEDALFEAVRRGRAYVAFDWMADPSGFEYFGRARKKRVEMGGDARAKDHPLLTVRPNMPCQLRLLRNGQEVQRTEGAELTFEARDPGVYRAEAWVPMAGGMRPWVYTNPIYVTP